MSFKEILIENFQLNNCNALLMIAELNAVIHSLSAHVTQGENGEFVHFEERATFKVL